MGLRGPAPIPTAVKDRFGLASHHTKNAKEPRLPSEVPACPKWLDADARKEWKRLMPILSEMRVITRADRNIAANYCQNHSHALKLLESIRKLNEGKTGLDGFVMVVGGVEVITQNERGEVIGKSRKGGQMQPNTLYSLYKQAVETETKLGALLGLDPSSRTRLQIAPTAEKKLSGPMAVIQMRQQKEAVQ